MGLNKVEQEFKDKLEQRTIRPTDMAWDRLDAMLSVAEEKKQPRKQYWMYIAASFLGFLLVGSILLRQEKAGTNGVDINTGTAVVNDVQPQSKMENKDVSEAENKVIDAIVPSQSDAVAVQQRTQVNPRMMQEKAVRPKAGISESKLSDTNIQEAVASHETEANPVQETEKLLAQSLDNTTPAKKSSLKVDAGSLLSSVESELDESFRSEVLQRVVKNYNTVKTSVANRNYQ